MKKALLKKVILKGDFASRCGAKKNKEVTFEFKEGVNLLAGPNGSGKSSLLNAIRTNTANADFVTEGGVRTWFLDFERQNPRVKGSLADSKSIRFDVTSHFRSHGEVVKALLTSFSSTEMEGCLALVDEPDMALDLEGLLQLKRALLESPAAQTLVACHSPFLLLSKEFHVVEMRKGYLNKLRKSFRGLAL